MVRNLRVLLMAMVLAVSPVAAQAQATLQLADLIVGLRIADFGDLMEKLYNARHVYVTRITELAGIRLQGDLLTRVVKTRERHLKSLRANVRNSREAMKALERHHESLEDVIFATATNDGGAMLYVDNR